VFSATTEADESRLGMDKPSGAMLKLAATATFAAASSSPPAQPGQYPFIAASSSARESACG
jgi:hypothetical protein